MTQVNSQNGRVLPDLSSLSQAQLVHMLLEAQAKLEAASHKKISFKVTDKGACSVYHGSRFPVTLYRQQWLGIIGAMPELEAFLKANASKLPLKSE